MSYESFFQFQDPDARNSQTDTGTGTGSESMFDTSAISEKSTEAEWLRGEWSREDIVEQVKKLETLVIHPPELPQSTIQKVEREANKYDDPNERQKVIDEKLREMKERRREVAGMTGKDMSLQLGYHVSPHDVDELTGDVEYANTLNELYQGKQTRWLYVIEGSGTDELSDAGHGWHIQRGKEREGGVTPLAKIPLTPEVLECLGASFANCVYHGQQ
jgi:predicted RNase H-like nuclease (RuvC/YqgF family)